MLAAVGLLVLIARPDRTATAGAAAWPWLAAADTDSVAVPDLIDPTAEDFVADGFGLAAPDTIDVDSLAADTTEVDSTLRARTYFQQPARTGSSVSIVPPFRPGIRGRLGTYWRRDVTLDSAAYVYRVRESVGDTEVRAPAEVSLSEFLAARRRPP